jgi:hypothetical protein
MRALARRKRQGTTRESLSNKGRGDVFMEKKVVYTEKVGGRQKREAS